jgi:hypothetical protein
MKFGTRSNLAFSAALGALAVCGMAMPAFASWGPMSAVAIQGQSKNCNYTPASASAARRAKVTVTRYLSDDPESSFAWWDDAIVQNRSANGKRADIFLWAYDDNFKNFELLRVYQDVPYNHTRSLMTSAPPLANLHASCQVSDNAK